MNMKQVSVKMLHFFSISWLIQTLKRSLRECVSGFETQECIQKCFFWNKYSKIAINTTS